MTIGGNSNSNNNSNNNKFVDEKFNIIPVKAILPEIEPPKPIEVIPPFTENDIYFLSETATSTLPCLIWPKLTPVPKDLLDKFNHEFYLYCRRKGYDPRDYLFDELGIAVAGLAIGSYHYKNYKEAYSKPEEKKKDDKLNADHSHKIEIEKKNEEQKVITEEVKL